MFEHHHLFERAKDLTDSIPVVRRADKPVPTMKGIEVETKVDLEGEHDADSTIQWIKKNAREIRKISIREQHHTLWAEGPDEYHSFVIPKKGQMRIRSKTKGELLMSPEGVLLFTRKEHKVTQNQKPFRQRLKRVLAMEPLGSFVKAGADIAFWKKNLAYTASVSVVGNAKRADVCQQLELEYDGHRRGTIPPTPQEILEKMEALARKLFRGKEFTTRTKLEWLFKENGHQPYLATYEAIAMEDSLLMPMRQDEDE